MRGMTLTSNRLESEEPAAEHGDKHDCEYATVLPGRGYDDGDEHGIQCNGERTDDVGRQNVPEDDSKHCPCRPAGNRYRGKPIGEVLAHGPFLTDESGEDLVGDVEAHKHAPPKRQARIEMDAQCGAHQEIADVDDRLVDCHLQIGASIRNDSHSCGLTCRSVVDKTHQQALQRVESRVAHEDSKREGYGEIADRDRQSVSYPPGI